MLGYISGLLLEVHCSIAPLFTCLSHPPQSALQSLEPSRSQGRGAPYALALIAGLRPCTHSTALSLLCGCSRAVAPRSHGRLSAGQSPPRQGVLPASRQPREGVLPASAGFASLGQATNRPASARVSTGWLCGGPSAVGLQQSTPIWVLVRQGLSSGDLQGGPTAVC